MIGNSKIVHEFEKELIKKEKADVLKNLHIPDAKRCRKAETPPGRAGGFIFR